MNSEFGFTRPQLRLHFDLSPRSLAIVAIFFEFSLHWGLNDCDLDDAGPTPLVRTVKEPQAVCDFKIEPTTK